MLNYARLLINLSILLNQELLGKCWALGWFTGLSGRGLSGRGLSGIVKQIDLRWLCEIWYVDSRTQQIASEMPSLFVMF